MKIHTGGWSGCIRRLLLVAILATGLLGVAEPAAADTAPTPIPVSGTPVLVSGGSGDQFNPRISGTLVSYTNANGGALFGETRYHDLATGVDAAIPTGGHRDSLPGVSGNNVVFQRLSMDDLTTRQIMLFDTRDPSGGAVELAPAPGVRRSLPAIGGRTVVWVEFAPNSGIASNVVAYDLDTRQAVPLTTDSMSIDYPDVSPDGTLVTWSGCELPSNTNCRIFAARRGADGTWATIELNNSDGQDLGPDTNGKVVAYASNAGGDYDIYWENADGTDEHQLPMLGSQAYPSVHGNLIAFYSQVLVGDSYTDDLFVYDLADGTLYQVTNTPTVRENLFDISVAPDGTAWMVWSQYEDGDPFARDIYALNFPLRSNAPANVAPALGAITAPTDPKAVNTSINVSAGFTDADTDDTHTATIDWGDGTSSTGAVTEANGSGTVGGGHAYSAAGVYTVSVTVTDGGGATDTASYQYVVVYDPEAGFATGAGWINSPAGAYAADPPLSGKANFGFVSKYQKGAPTPSGRTQFQFKAGSLDFQSTAYEWLVISGPKAQYKGSGTVNGTAGYGFLLTANDGQVSGGGGVDKFRIKIWEKSTGSVLYDNQMGDADDAAASTAIQGGSVVIHK